MDLREVRSERVEQPIKVSSWLQLVKLVVFVAVGATAVAGCAASSPTGSEANAPAASLIVNGIPGFKPVSAFGVTGDPSGKCRTGGTPSSIVGALPGLTAAAEQCWQASSTEAGSVSVLRFKDQAAATST